MNLYHTIFQLAADRYATSQEYDDSAAENPRSVTVARATESIMCALQSDVEDGLYTDEDEEAVRHSAACIADSYGLDLDDILNPPTPNVVQRYEKAALQAQINFDRAVEVQHKIDTATRQIETSLHASNLTIDRISFRKTGDSDWREDDQVFLEVHAKPLNTKFKFLKFQGYDSHGNGRNQKRLLDKAVKLEEKLAIKDGIGVSVNYYSLEDVSTRRRPLKKSQNGVLITFRLF